MNWQPLKIIFNLEGLSVGNDSPIVITQRPDQALLPGSTQKIGLKGGVEKT